MGFVVRQKTKTGRFNLYFALSFWDKKAQVARQSRKYLGQLSEDGLEIIKSRSLTSFSADEQNALLKSGIEFKGRECLPPGRKSSRQRKTSAAALREWRSVEYGRIASLRLLSEQCGLTAALEAGFEEDAQNILASAIFECVEGKALYRVGDWAEDTILSEEKNALSGSSTARLTESTGSDLMGRSAFFREWIKQRKFPKALIHDTTSVSSYGEKISMVEWGYNRDKEKLPQVNFALVYAAKDQLPLFYRLIPGSIPDVATLNGTAARLEEYGLKNFTFALDRGYFSAGNLLEMLKNKQGFTIGLPLDNSEAVRMLNTNRRKLESIVNGLLVGDAPYRYAEDVFSLKNPGKRGQSHKLKAHIFINCERRDRMKNELDSLLLAAQNQFKKEKFNSRFDAEDWCAANFRGHRDLYSLTGERSSSLRLTISAKAYEKKIRNYGVFIILNSDPAPDGLSTLIENRRRDNVEKLFDTLKNATGNDRLHSASDAVAEGKMMIGFVATILHSLMENRLREKGMLVKMTVNQAFDLLRKIRVAIGKDGKRVIQEIPKKTRDLLDNIDLTLPNP